MATNQVALCEECYAPATRPCTRCGRPFCELHLRFGNPHYRQSQSGKVGYYCHQCWTWRMFLAGVRRAVVYGLTAFLVVFSLISLGRFALVLGIIRVGPVSSEVRSATPNASFRATLDARATYSYATVSAEHTAAVNSVAPGGQ